MTVEAAGEGIDDRIESGPDTDLSTLDVFERQVDRTPTAIAIESDDLLVTYVDLDTAANAVARELIALGVERHDRVAVAARRSPEAIVAFLGVVKAGAAYVPLDPDDPSSRLQLMLDDTEARVVLVQERYVETMRPYVADLVVMPPLQDRPLGAHAARPNVRPDARGLIYVMYTSGSTGRPKGVAIEHHSVVQRVRGAHHLMPRPGESMLQVSELDFDAQTWEIWGALLNGARLVLAPPERPDPRHLGRLLIERRVNVALLATGLFHQMVEGALASLGELRLLLVGGDVLSPAHAGRFIAAHPSCPLVNLYGPTEVTVCCSWHAVDTVTDEQPVSIGRALGNSTLAVLDEEIARPVAPGEIGELYIGGPCVARGYLNLPGETAERFVRDPSSPESDSRLYRTGDRVREGPDGNLAYLGRIDDQVKVRGFRIEPAEVEAALLGAPGIAHAAVIAREDRTGHRRLVAYVTRPSPVDSVDDLRDFLTGRLPAHMIPSSIVVLDQLPVTSRGKIDRAALAAMKPAVRPRDRIGPRSELEEELAKIWAEMLDIEDVSTADGFLELGGDSLLAVRVLTRVRDALGVDLPIDAVFESETLGVFAARIEQARAEAPGPALPPIRRSAPDTPVAASPMQSQALLASDLAGDALPYQFQAVVHLHGVLDVEALETALTEIVRRHEVLRTRFPRGVDGWSQVVEAPFRVRMPVIDLRGSSDAERELDRVTNEAFRTRIAVDRLPLARWTLARVADDHHVLVHVEHHVVHDGWSWAVFLGELAACYRAAADDDAPALAEPELQFRDFARWQHSLAETDAGRQQLEYWTRQLSDPPPPLQLPADRPRPTVSTWRGGQLISHLPPDLVARLRELGRAHGATLFMTMLAAFFVTLYRYAEQEDLVVGSGVANRRWPETEQLIGMVLNTVALRVSLSPDLTVADLLQRVRRVTLDAYAHQDVPFERVLEALAPARQAGALPVYQALFSFQDPPPPHLDVPRLSMVPDDTPGNGSAKADLNIVVIDQRERAGAPVGLTLLWEYATDLFDEATAARMRDSYRVVLESFTEAPKAAVTGVRVLPEPEAGLTPADGSSYPRDASIVDLWEEQVARSPDALAVRDSESDWTYAELDVFANRLAHVLREKGVGHQELVGVCLTRGRAAVACMLGILKAGAAYLPLDLHQPERRIAWLANDAGIRLVLTYSYIQPFFRTCTDLEALCLDELDEELARKPVTSPPPVAAAESLAYVMFTSGSTGPPKGVEILHRGVVRLLFGVEYVRLAPDVRILHLAPLSFDASTFEIWSALLHGGSVVVFPEDIPHAASLGRAIAEEAINTMWLNAALFNAIVDQDVGALAPLEQLLIGGEALSVEHVHRAYRGLPRTQIINGYGPTENTTFSCCYAIPRAWPASIPSVPIGAPIAHSTAHVLDDRMRPVPRGAIGEIYLGGDGVARGYRAEPELTAQRFLPDPFSSVPGARLYRSGDLGRLRSDGTLEFRGRRDDQVKIRGFRIEPAEIEWALHRLPGVHRSAVIATKEVSSVAQLVAYVVLEPEVVPDAEALRRQLGLELPAHMVPDAIVVLDALPLTPRGKLDRAALPAPPPRTTGRGLVPPRNAREEIVAGVMAEVLGIEEVRVDDQFFDLGGHSLIGLQLVSRLSQVFGIEIPVRALIENPTVGELADLIERRAERPEDASSARAGSGGSLIPIKPGGSKQPLFFTPGGDGGDGALLVYAKVARFVGAEHPFYGLRARGINDDKAPHRSVEEMAADYLAEVKEFQPRGPYFFGGECVGGVIAYEMARQAQAAGDDVGLLVLLDSRPPRVTSYGRHSVRFLSSRTRRLADRILGPMTPAPAAAARRARTQARLRRWLDARLPYDAKEAPPTIKRSWVRYQRTLLRYRARPYPGRMALILSDQYATKSVGREWERLVQGGVDIQLAVGDHDSYLRENARMTAEILAACLDRAGEPTTGGYRS